jgi:predicted PurR-regulated permease PerM
MTPLDPPPPPPGSGDPSGAIPRPIDPVTTGATPTTTARTRSQTLFGSENPVWRFFKRWGFPLFILLIVIWGRSVLLPFVFAALIAYILAPVVQWMSVRKDDTRRMPRGVAILICYLVFIGAVVGFMFLLVPRLSSDVKRIGEEAPTYAEINEKWTPAVAHWLEERFPSLKPKPVAKVEKIVPDVPLPPKTAFTVTPLPDGRIAVQIAGNGIDVTPLGNGSYHIDTNDTPVEPQDLEDKLRTFVRKAMESLQSQVNGLVALGQSVITAFIRGIFMFFFTLMIAAFILLDLDAACSRRTSATTTTSSRPASTAACPA